MKGILFVDDEPAVLEGLRCLLRKQRHQWRMAFVTSGEAALRELEQSPYDVMVSDMRMPQMDGATLLSRVQEDYPHVVRIVLSGQTEQDVSGRMVHVAHQFLAKPCDGRELLETLERACLLQDLLQHPRLRQVVGKMGQLPVKPSIYTRLNQVLASPRSSMADAAAVIEQDMGTSAKILQMVNSAFFGLPQRVGDIKSAVTYLGLEMVKMVALSVEMRRSQTAVVSCPGFSLEALQAHGMLSGRIARRLLQSDRTEAQDAFSAAMLADAGVLVIMSRLPELFRSMLDEARRSSRTLAEVELELMGLTHAEIGAYLLGLWGLPYTLVEAVAHHRSPIRVPVTPGKLDVTTAVHVASALAEQITRQDPGLHIGPGVHLDLAHLQAMGVTDRIPAWREMAFAEAGASGY